MTNKTCVVFAATSEIARETIANLKTDFGRFVLTARSKDKLKHCIEKIEFPECAEIIEVIVDLTDAVSVAKLGRELIARFPDIELVFAAQGINDISNDRLINFNSERCRSTIDLNYLSVVNSFTPFVDFFKLKKRGQLVAIASIAGLRGRRYNYIYGASKAALIVYLAGLRLELQSYNVTVTTVFPGLVTSPISDHSQGRLAQFLFCQPSQVGPIIAKRLRQKPKVIYTPRIWWWVAWSIQLLPDKILLKLPDSN